MTSLSWPCCALPCRYALPVMQPDDASGHRGVPAGHHAGQVPAPVQHGTRVVAKLCCRPFHPTLCLATACGMQVLCQSLSPLPWPVACKNYTRAFSPLPRPLA